MFRLSYGTDGLKPAGSITLLSVAVLLGIVLHELIHGMSWVTFGRKRFYAIKFGFQWKTLTPYAHLKEPVH